MGGEPAGYRLVRHARQLGDVLHPGQPGRPVKGSHRADPRCTPNGDNACRTPSGWIAMTFAPWARRGPTATAGAHRTGPGLIRDRQLPVDLDLVGKSDHP